jgi:hypothetical protein
MPPEKDTSDQQPVITTNQENSNIIGIITRRPVDPTERIFGQRLIRFLTSENSSSDGHDYLPMGENVLIEETPEFPPPRLGRKLFRLRHDGSITFLRHKPGR